MSTVEPGRKPVENDDSDHLQPNGDISSDMIHDTEMAKNDNKLSTNGTSDKHKNCIANELMAKAETASSSGTSAVKVADAEEKVAEIDTPVVSESAVSDDEPAQVETVASKLEEQTANEDEVMKTETIVAQAIEAVEPIVDVKPVIDDKPAEMDTTTPEQQLDVKKAEEEEIVKEEPKKIEKTPDTMQTEPALNVATEANAATPSAVEEKPSDAANEPVPMEETVKNTPPTPKRAASGIDNEEDGENDDSDSMNPCAKKIRLDLDTVEEKKPEIEAATTMVEVELPKEADILDSIDKLTDEIDAQKESELLEEVNISYFINAILILAFFLVISFHE